MEDTATPTPRLEREMVQEALEGLAELVVRGVRASADPGEAAGKAGAGLRALGVWVERLAGEASEGGDVGREPVLERVEVPVGSVRMSLGIPSAVGVLDRGDFPEAFVVMKESEEEAVLAEGDSFLMVDGPWGPVVVLEEEAVRVEVAGEGAVREEPEAAELLVAAGEVKVEAVEAVEAAVVEAVTVPEEKAVVAVPELVAPLAAMEPVAEVRVPEVVFVVEETPVVAVPLVAVETDVKVPEEVPVEEKTPEVVVPLAVSEPEVKVAVREEPVVVEREAKGPVEAGREAVGWRMPLTAEVAPPGSGARLVIWGLVLVMVLVVGWLLYTVMGQRRY